MDAKDILGLPKTPPSLPLEKKSRPPKESQRKPDGISREVYALTGGLPPFIPAIDVSHLKPRSLSQEKITWRWLPFTSSARNDNLQLCHWAKIVNGVFPTGDYSFAKYNKSVDIVVYSDEEYEKHLSDDAWTREETDQLFELCKQFELRFIVIADRFSSPRTVEELKDRYYSVSRAIISARASSPNEVSSHPLIREAYNVKLEIERKRSLSMLLSHTKQQERKDSEVLAEAKRISDLRIAAKGAEERELAAASNPESNTTGKERSLAMPVPVDGDSSIMASLRMLPVYLRTYAFEQMVQSITSATGLRTVKRMEQSLQELGVNAKPRLVTRAVCKEHMDLRREILALLNLQKQYKEAENSSTQRLHAADLDRPDSSFCFAAAGERASKDLKRKGVGRASNSPASPAQHTKRPRKIKASDS